MKDLLHKKRSKKGFTLAELLIVIAIIAVLIAIAIPIFTAQLEKSRHAVDDGALRSAMSLAEADYMLNHADAESAVYIAINGAETDVKLGNTQQLEIAYLGAKTDNITVCKTALATLKSNEEISSDSPLKAQCSATTAGTPTSCPHCSTSNILIIIENSKITTAGWTTKLADGVTVKGFAEQTVTK